MVCAAHPTADQNLAPKVDPGPLALAHISPPPASPSFPFRTKKTKAGMCQELLPLSVYVIVTSTYR